MNFVSGLVSMGTGNPAEAAAEQREAENHGTEATVAKAFCSRRRRSSFCERLGVMRAAFFWN